MIKRKKTEDKSVYFYLALRAGMFEMRYPIRSCFSGAWQPEHDNILA